MTNKFIVKVITDKQISQLADLCNNQDWEIFNVAACDKQIVYLLRKLK